MSVTFTSFEKNQFSQKATVLPLFYWGDIFWLKYWSKYPDEISFSKVQTYRKQRNFNRTYILGGNGVDKLIIPVSYEGIFPQLKEIKICYKENWQSLHLKKIYYAYKNSAFFEHYWHYIEKVYQFQPEYLWELNYECVKSLALILGWNLPPIIEDYIPEFSFSYRLEEVPPIELPAYFQLFTKNFIPNLSSLDLIFNLGTEVQSYLNRINWIISGKVS